MIFCEVCNYKTIFTADESPAGLTVLPSSNIQLAVPRYDKEQKKTIATAALERQPMAKCPKCGRGVRIKELSSTYSKAFEAIDQQMERKHLEEDRQKRIEDGKPLEKKHEHADEKKSNRTRH
jgi:hypothetical protein